MKGQKSRLVLDFSGVKKLARARIVQTAIITFCCAKADPFNARFPDRIGNVEAYFRGNIYSPSHLDR